MNNEHINRHGFDLFYQKGWAVLVVPPEKERHRKIYYDDVASIMKLLNIPSVPAGEIRKIIKKGSGKPEPLVRWPDGEKLGAKVLITVSEDKMSAYAEIIPPHPGGAPADKELIYNALEQNGIVYGINSNAVDNLLESGMSGSTKTVIAKGKSPKAGKTAHTECFFATVRGKPWQEFSDGRINLKELNFIQNRKKGDLLARNVSAVQPEDGFNVMGEVIQPPLPEEKKIYKAGTGVNEKDGEFYAEIDGNVRIENDCIIVEDSITVNNVDYSTGNLDIDGSVTVKGTVADGFSVKASGDIQIQKTIGRCRVEAGRDILLAGGFVGNNEGFCSAGNNLCTKFMENAKAEIKGNLFFSEALINSELEVNGNIVFKEGRGEIIGGRIVAGKNIICKKTGSSYAGRTKIFAGCPPDELRNFLHLIEELKDFSEKTDELERQKDYLAAREGINSPEVVKLNRYIEERREKMKETAEKLKKNKKSIKAENGTFVSVENRIFPGTVISFGLEEYRPPEKGIEKTILKYENGSIELHGLKPGEDPENLLNENLNE